MPTGLKKELGLGEPKPKGSTEQADKFKAAFQAVSAVINECLQYTAAHAEKPKHDPMVDKRGKTCEAYQVALSRIDSTNPSVAQGAIDQVLAGVESLKSAAESLKKTAEEALKKWTAREGEFHKISDKIREMVDWGHEKAGTLAEVCKVITGKTNEKAYEGACTVLDQLSAKFGPILEEYQKQKAAQEEYEAALPGLETRLEPTRKSSFKSLESMQKDLATAEQQMKEAAGKKDFVTALSLLRTLEGNLTAFETKLKELGEKKKQFEAARGPVDEKLKQASTEKFDELATLDQEITDLTKQMDEAVANDDYDQANTLLSQLAAKADEKAKKVEELKAKEEYETALKAEEAKLTKADGTDPAGHFELKNNQTAYQTAKKELDSLVTAKDYQGALAKLPGVAASAKTYVDQRKGYDDYKTEEAKVQADLEYVRKLRYNSPPNPAYDAENALYGQMINSFEQGKFAEALTCMKTLQGKVADLKKRVDENDKKAKPAAEAAEKEVQKLAGDKKIADLTDDEKAALVKKLKKLPLEKQQKIMEDLHGPSGKLSDEQRQIQIAMYHAMDLDGEFKKEDAKFREKYQQELQKDEELKTALRTWNKKKDGKDVVDAATKQKMFAKVLEAQSKAYGINVPKIEWYEGDEGDFGSFSMNTTRMKLNTRYLDNAQEMIDTIIHENTHNFQEDLVKKYIAGKIPKTDPMYQQARTFAITHHMDAYVDSDEDEPAYKAQPEEMQAWEAGETEAKKLMKAAKKKPKK